MKVAKFLMCLAVFCLTIAPCSAQFGVLPESLEKVDSPLAGRVLTPKDEPVLGARVSCVGNLKKGDGKVVTLAVTQTDAEGRYRLDIPAIVKNGATINGVLAESKGRGLGVAEIYNVKNGILDIKLRPSTALRLTFVDDNGNFIPNVSMRLTSLSAPQGQQAMRPYASAIFPNENRWQAQTNAEGTVTFPDLPQGFYATYRVEDQRFAKPLRSGFSDTGNVRLDERALTSAAPDILSPVPLGSIAGRLTFSQSNKPIAGAKVSLGSAESFIGNIDESITNTNGEFKFGGLFAGHYDVYCVLKDEIAKEWATPRLENIVLKEGQQLAGQDIALTKGALVKGRVVAEEGGVPVAKSYLYVYKNGSDNTVGDTTNQDGTFGIRVPAGEHSIRLNTDYDGPYDRAKQPVVIGLQTSLFYDASHDGWKFKIADGQILNLEFRLPLKEKKHPIDVFVLDANGAPVEGAFLVEGAVSTPTRGVGKGWEQSGTDAQGHTNVYGPVTVRAFKGNSATLQPVRADGDKVTLRLEENAIASFKGRVVDADGAPLPNAEIELFPADENADRYISTARADEKGAYSIGNLWPNSAYRVRAKGTGSIPRQTEVLKVQRGQTTQVPEIRLAKANSFVAGRVVNLKNQPVAGAEVECSGNDTARQTMTTGADGRFRFDNIVPESVTISVRKDYRTNEERYFIMAPAGTDFWLSKFVAAKSDDIVFKIRHF